MSQELTSLEPLLPLLERRPVGIVSDIDGTLSPIVPDPDAARITPKNLQLLRDLLSAGACVALITGRALEKARSMAPLEGVAIAANHGLNVWVGGQAYAAREAAEYAKHAKQVVRELAALSAEGVVVEDKGAVIAFHYRNAPDGTSARQAILAAISSSPSSKGFAVQEGRKLIELRPSVGIDKGTALRELAERLGMRSVICMGDDTTDLDMFRGALELRERGMAAVTVAVVSEEMTPAVMESADYWVRGVAGVEWLLESVLIALRDSAP